MRTLEDLLKKAVAEEAVPGAAARVARGDDVEIASVGEVEPESIVRHAGAATPAAAGSAGRSPAFGVSEAESRL
jgi:hypothetical protein